MNFQERRRVALAATVDFFGRFSAPRGLSESAQEENLQAVADLLARKMPTMSSDAFFDALVKVFKSVGEGHTTYFWPSQAAVASCIPAPVSERSAPETFKLESPERWAADLMGRGQAVPESFVWGMLSDRLLAEGLVMPCVRDAYRQGSVEAYRKTYKQDAEMIMAGQLGDVVRPYFSNRAVAVA